MADGTVVTRLVVVDGPWQHGPHWVPEIPACTLDEFESLLAAQDWRSTDREELWAFLDELTSLGADGGGNGYAEVICWSILDAWEAWTTYGMLCPAWIDPRTCGFIPPRDLQLSWARDALLDDADAVLASLGLNGTRGRAQLIPTPVPAAQAGSDEESVVVTLTLYQPRRIWWVAADMGLVVRADLEFRDDLTFSRAAVGMLASTIEDTLREVARNEPPAWQLWRQAHGEHPTSIQLIPGHLPEDMPALRFVGLSERADLIVADPERLARQSPANIHSLIGEALTFSVLARLQPSPDPDDPAEDTDDADVHAAVEGARFAEPDEDPGAGRVMELHPSEEDIRRAETFRAAWQGIRPRFTQRANLGPFKPYALTSAQTLSENGQHRAMRTIARRLKTQLDPGVHPLRVVLAQLCPGAMEALTEAARDYAPRAALAAACAELERALSDRFASRASLEVNLSSPWADETLSALDVRASSEDTRRSRVAELLIERLLSEPPAGSLIPDRRDIHQLLDLASAALEASQEAQYAYAAIQPAALKVSELGDLDIERTGTAKADDRAWQKARLEEEAHAFTAGGAHPFLAAVSDETELSNLGDGDSAAKESVRSILESDVRESSGYQALNAGGMLNVDDQLLEHCGFGLDSIVAVLTTVTAWDVPAEPHPPLTQIRRAFLVDTVAARSGIPREQVDAAVAACTLSADHIGREGLRYWQLRERSARLALRPLIAPPGAEDDGVLWLLPRCAYRTQHLLLAYLNDQQLPWPDKDLPKPVIRAVKAWHKIAEDQLEKELAAAARSAGLACRANLTEQKAARESLVLHGEIDLIAADPHRRRIWIIEAKHLRRVFSPLEIAFRVADFHGPAALATGRDTNEFRQFRSRSFRPYVQRVIANAHAVELNKQAAARLISAVTPGQPITEGSVADWDVIPIMVTSQVEVAAFVPQPQIPFVLIDHLKGILMTETSPVPGWWRPDYNLHIR